MVPLVSRKLVTAVAVIGAVLPVTIAWGAVDFSYGGTPRWLARHDADARSRIPQLQPHLRQRRTTPSTSATGPIGPAGTCYAGTTIVGNASYINIGTSGSYGYGTAGAKCGDYVTLYVDCHTTQP